MRRRPGAKATLAALAVALTCVSADAADQSSWMPLLKMQLKESHGCVIDVIVYSREMKTGEDTGTEGRVRCIDRREYDFTRREEHQRFEIRLCQPTVC